MPDTLLGALRLQDERKVNFVMNNGAISRTDVPQAVISEKIGYAKSSMALRPCHCLILRQRLGSCDFGSQTPSFQSLGSNLMVRIFQPPQTGHSKLRQLNPSALCRDSHQIRRGSQNTAQWPKSSDVAVLHTPISSSQSLRGKVPPQSPEGQSLSIRTRRLCSERRIKWPVLTTALLAHERQT